MMLLVLRKRERVGRRASKQMDLLGAAMMEMSRRSRLSRMWKMVRSLSRTCRKVDGTGYEAIDDQGRRKCDDL